MYVLFVRRLVFCILWVVFGLVFLWFGGFGCFSFVWFRVLCLILFLLFVCYIGDFVFGFSVWGGFVLLVWCYGCGFVRCFWCWVCGTCWRGFVLIGLFWLSLVIWGGCCLSLLYKYVERWFSEVCGNSVAKFFLFYCVFLFVGVDCCLVVVYCGCSVCYGLFVVLFELFTWWLISYVIIVW